MDSSSSRGDEQPQFGLILHPAKQKKQALVQRKTIFDDDLEDSESDDEQTKLKLPERNISKPLYPGRSATQVKSTLNAALEEDPSIFEYDEVYDDMHAEKEKAAPKKVTNPKYMDNLLKSAELRKREKEKREERKIQKEREAEGDEFADKEVFITPAYKEKLEELKKTEERERKEAAFEAALDVTKQQDLSGFYRHLLKQTVGEEKILLHSISSRFDNLHEPSPEETASSKFNKVKNSKNRRIRQRNESVSSEEEKEENTIDAMRRGKEKTGDKRVDSRKKEKDALSKDEEEEEKKKKKEASATQEQESSRKSDSSSVRESNESRKDGSHGQDDCVVEKKKAEEKDEEVKLAKVNKVDRRTLIIELFTKRTVGQVFEEARQRYLERKAGTSSSTCT